MFLVIAIPALAEQPLAAVTITVSLPAAVTEIEAAFPKLLFHEYVPPPEAVKLIDELVQFISVVLVLLVIEAMGEAFIVINPDTVLVLSPGEQALLGAVTLQ